HLGGDLAVDAHAGRRIVLQADVALEGDKGPGPLHAQALRGADRLRDRLVVLARAEAREGPSDVADAAELVERSAQLRLEHDDDRDDEEEGRVAERPGEKEQVEG